MSELDQTILFLKKLIQTPSFSGEESQTAEIITSHFDKNNIPTRRIYNNVIAVSQKFDKRKKTILLNSHHDTVKVANGWTYPPFGAVEKENKLYGLGSNDAGASLVCLIHTFIKLYESDLPFNLILAATGEEENFGPNGLSALLDDHLPHCHFGIIGEPTKLQLGVAQKGLIVIDGEMKGKAGHAARKTGINAIYKASKDIHTIMEHEFSRVSDYLGPTTVQLTQINAGSTHNVIPDKCTYVLDVRVNELYTLKEAFDELDNITDAKLVPRSLKWHSKGIDKGHPIFEVGQKFGISAFGSPTLSDQVHCTFPTVKIGPGESPRSHTADEYIKIQEIKDGVRVYEKILLELGNHIEKL